MQLLSCYENFPVPKNIVMKIFYYRPSGKVSISRILSIFLNCIYSFTKDIKKIFKYSLLNISNLKSFVFT